MAETKKSSIGGKSTCHLLNIKQPDRAAKRMKLSFQRTKATIMVLKTGHNVEASMGLIDLSETGAGLFTHELLLKGSTVEVCITDPRLLKVKGLVAWSVPVKSGMHAGKYKFRSGVQFYFENEVQRTAVLEFIQKVNMDPLESIKQGVKEALPDAGLAPAAVAAPVAEAVPAADPAAAPAPSLTEAPKPAEEAPAPAADAAATATPQEGEGEGEGGGQSQAA